MTLEVGALGELDFGSGWYAYTGSALGSGGFARVDRHRRVARSGTDRPHWHVDYLLEHAVVSAAHTLPGVDRECEIARRLPGDPVPGFGASDCDCGSHLVHDPDGTALRQALETWYCNPDDGST